MINLPATQLDAVKLSIIVSMLSTILVLPIAIAIAWKLARSRFYGKSVVEALISIPLVLPPVVTGYFLLLILGRNGFVGRYLWDSFGLQLSFTWYGAAVAAAVVSFPLGVRAIRQAFESVDPKFDDVACTLGASKLKRFITIHIPLAKPGLIAGTLLVFARSLGEFGATITFVGNIPGETRTIPLAIYSTLQRPNGESESMTLVLCSVSLSVLAVLLGEFYLSAHKREMK